MTATTKPTTTCAACDYPLNIEGESQVRCPECGFQHDADRLAERQSEELPSVGKQIMSVVSYCGASVVLLLGSVWIQPWTDGADGIWWLGGASLIIGLVGLYR